MIASYQASERQLRDALQECANKRATAESHAVRFGYGRGRYDFSHGRPVVSAGFGEDAAVTTWNTIRTLEEQAEIARKAIGETK